MLTKELTVIEKMNRTTRELRRNELASGRSFLCTEGHLPREQAILEYPDGRFEVVKITGVLSKPEFVREASHVEIHKIKTTNPAYGE